MKEYLRILNDVITTGHQKSDRTGTGTTSKFAMEFRHDMRVGFPLLTTKKINPTQVFGELVGFLKGATTLEEFHEYGCTIWDHWGLAKDYVKLTPLTDQDRHEALASKLNITIDEAIKMLACANESVKIWENSRNENLVLIMNETTTELGGICDTSSVQYQELYNEKLEKYMRTRPQHGDEILRSHEINLYKTTTLFSKGDLGPIYGEQWLNWQSSQGKLINQIQMVAAELANNPDSRRMVVSGWNPSVIPGKYAENPLSLEPVTNSSEGVQAAICSGKQALPPCHLMFILNTHTELSGERVVNMQVIMRSTDVAVGLPYNVCSYGALLEIIAKKHNLIAGELVITMTDCHVYHDQVELAQLQLTRTPTELPTFKLDTVIDYTDPDSLGKHTVDALVNAIKGYEPQAFIKYPVSV